MSIASEITRLQGVKADIIQAITDKGVTVPSSAKLDDMAQLIESITGGGGTDVYIKNCEAFLSLNYDPAIYKEVSYVVEQEQTQYEYYIGGIASAPCRNANSVGCVIGANNASDFSCAGQYIRDWNDSSWNIGRFYLYSIPNLTYPLYVRLLYKGNGTFELYLNNSLYLTLNNIDVSVWNRSKLFYMGPGSDVTQNKLKIKDLTLKK